MTRLSKLRWRGSDNGGALPFPSSAGEGGAIGRRETPVSRRAMAPDGVWPAAATQVGLQQRQRKPAKRRPCFPHPIPPHGPLAQAPVVHPRLRLGVLGSLMSHGVPRDAQLAWWSRPDPWRPGWDYGWDYGDTLLTLQLPALRPRGLRPITVPITPITVTLYSAPNCPRITAITRDYGLRITVTLYSRITTDYARITVTLYSTPNCPPRLGPAAPWARIAAVPWRRGDRGKGGEPSGRPIRG